MRLTPEVRREYSDYMRKRVGRSIELKIVQIGNSRGVRLPKAVLERYAINDAVVLEAREDGLLLRNKRDKRLSWDDTYRDMARAREAWSDLEPLVSDGLD